MLEVHPDLPTLVAGLITDDINEVKEYFAAVAMVRNKDCWLLGLAKRTGDGRTGHWCFPGGRLKPGESPVAAAARECYEETGIRCDAADRILQDDKHPGVAFVPCTVAGQMKLKPNHEFAALGFFSMRDMKGIKLFGNVKPLIEKV